MKRSVFVCSISYIASLFFLVSPASAQLSRLNINEFDGNGYTDGLCKRK